jgi:hypothetical protein
VVKPEDIDYPWEQIPTDSTGAPIKDEPLFEDDETMPDAPDPVLSVSLPELEDELIKYKISELPKTNKTIMYNLDGSSPISGPTPREEGLTVGPNTLFQEICPDTYSRRYATYNSAMSASGGTGVFGEPASATHLFWWSTNFASSFTEETYGTYTSKNAASNRSTLILCGAACWKATGLLDNTTKTEIWVKWGYGPGVTATTPYMQFLDKNEAGDDVVFNFELAVPFEGGKVNVAGLNLLIAINCPYNGCFFYMDLRKKTIIFQIMDGAKTGPKSIAPRDWIADPNPKDETPDDEDDTDDDDDEEDVAAQVQAAVNAALAAAAITQEQALSVQAASAAADKAQALASQQEALTTQLNAAVNAAIAAGQLSQQQAVAAQKAADDYAQSTALSAQAAADASQMAQAVASAVAAQAAKDATQQQAAVAAQAAADASAQQAAVASAVAAQAAKDATALQAAVKAQSDRDAAAYTLPAFAGSLNVSVGSSYTGSQFSIVASLAGMDYSHAWLKALDGYDQTAYTGNNDLFSTLAGAQANSKAAVGIVICGNSSSWYGVTAIQSFKVVSSSSIYSGWLRKGSPTQLVGWVIKATPTGSTTVGYALVVTGYGFTSLSPTAKSGMSGSTTYNLTTKNVQAEILANMFPVDGISGVNLGFIYDASVGTYGQVTWISQI